MVLPPTSRVDGGCGHTGGGDIRCQPPEHSCKIYCDKAHCEPVYGGGMEPGVKGVEAVMGGEGVGTVGDTDGVSDGGIRIGGGEE